MSWRVVENRRHDIPATKAACVDQRIEPQNGGEKHVIEAQPRKIGAQRSTAVVTLESD